MSEDKWEGKWKSMKGQIRQQWGRLTDDDVEQIEGQRERLLGKIQERYGESKESADAQLREFERRF